MRYHYVAYSITEGITKGRVDAPDATGARLRVHASGYKPLSMKQGWQLPSREELFPSLFRARTKDVLNFSRELATMIRSGANIQRALEILEAGTQNRVMRRIIGDIRASVGRGEPLSSAMGDHPQVFGALFVSLVRVGEFTGDLAPALEQIADMMDRGQETKQKVLRTLMMPMVNLVMAVLMLLLMVTVVLPPLFESFENGQAPLLMRAMLGLVDGIKGNLLPVAGGAVATVIALRLLQRGEAVKTWLDGVKSRVPVLGSVLVAGELSRFSRSMAMLLDSGVHLSEALRVGINGCNNRAVRWAFVEAENSLLSGRSLTEPLQRHPVLPRLWVELITIGEQGNSLPSTFRSLADAYEKRAEEKINTLVAVLDPVSTLAVGGVVALIAFSTLQPILSQMSSLAP